MARKKVQPKDRFRDHSDLELRVLRDSFGDYLTKMIRVVNELRSRDPEGYAQARELWQSACDLDEEIRREVARRNAARVPPEPK
jgi:glucose-6-phosphate-specific signal transduction histidine kinase